jgi:hypothetical protein
VRDELLNLEPFSCLLEARVVIEDARQDYNQQRPHSALGTQGPGPVRRRMDSRHARRLTPRATRARTKKPRLGSPSGLASRRASVRDHTHRPGHNTHPALTTGGPKRGPASPPRHLRRRFIVAPNRLAQCPRDTRSSQYVVGWARKLFTCSVLCQQRGSERVQRDAPDNMEVVKMARRWAAALAVFVVTGLLGVTLVQSGASAGRSPSAQPTLPAMKAPERLRLSPQDARRALKPPVVKRASRTTRDASRRTHRGLGDSAAFSLARKRFSITTPQARLALDEPGTRVVRPVGDYAAVVSVGRQRALTVSSLPLTARSGSGRKTRASLTLQSRGSSYAPQAPLVPLQISKSLRRGFLLAGNIRVQPIVARNSQGRRNGQIAFFANADTDTDVLVQATPQGAETFWQLRSDRSAEEHRLRFTLPNGATLRMSPRMPGGAEIVAGGRPQFTIPPPTAHDADGTAVPLTMRIASNVLTITARHKGRGLHYPILVDPALNGVVRENYGDFYNPGSAAQAGFPNFTALGPTPPFGFAKSTSLQVFGFTGTANGFGVYSIQAPGSAQIFRADIDNAYFLNPTFKLAYFYATVGPSAPGHASAWTNNAYSGTSNGGLPLAFPLSFGPLSFTFCAGHVNGMSDVASPGFCTPGAGAGSNYFQVGVYTAVPWANGNFLTQVGGASVSLTDVAPPTGVTLSGIPNSWVQNAPSNVTVSGQQAGLGIGAFSVIGPAGDTLRPVQDLGCYFNNATPPSQTGATSTTLPPCPQSATSSAFDLSPAELPEGITAVRGTAQSITGVTTQSGESSLKIDQSAPEVTLTGSLIPRFGSSVSQPTTLHVDAPDKTGAIATSGTASVVVQVDGIAVAQSIAACPAGDCARSVDYTFVPSNYAVGSHEIMVTATDVAGNAAAEGHRIRVVRPRAPGTPSAVDMFGTQLKMRVQGAAANDRLGTSVAEIGDVNGDGVSDVAVGAPAAAPNGRLAAGAAYVVYGGSGTVDVANLTAAQGFRIVGAGVGDAAGSSVAGIGDINVDGLPDVAVGAPRDGLAGLQLLRGSVYVIFGSPGTPGEVDLFTLGSRGFRIDGPLLSSLPGARGFGTVIASPAGSIAEDDTDVNGDGRGDVLIGDPAASRDLLRQQSGRAYVVFGKGDTGNVDVSALGAAGRLVEGAVGAAALGKAVAFVGDHNADAIADVAVGAPGVSAIGRSGGGTVYVILGSQSIAPLDTGALGNSGYTILGASGQRIGGSIAALGDQNNDGSWETGLGGRQPVVLNGPLDESRPGTTIDLLSAFAGYRILPSLTLPSTSALVITASPDVDADAIDDVTLMDPVGPARYWTVYGHGNGGDIDLANLDASDGFPVTSVNTPPLTAISASDDVADVGATGTLVGIAQAAPNNRAGAGEAYVVAGPAKPDCLSERPVPSPGSYLAECDRLGLASLQAASVTTPPALRSQEGRASFGSFPEYPNPFGRFEACEKVGGNFGSFKCRQDDDVTLRYFQAPDPLPKRIARVRLRATMELGAFGHRKNTVLVRMSAKAQKTGGGRPAINHLAARCRIFKTGVFGAPDKDCGEGPEFYEIADPIYSYNPFRHPARSGDSIETSYPSNSARRFYEFAYMFDVEGYTNSDPFSLGLFRIRPGRSMQSPRFRCREPEGGDLTRCQFGW